MLNVTCFSFFFLASGPEVRISHQNGGTLSLFGTLQKLSQINTAQLRISLHVLITWLLLGTRYGVEIWLVFSWGVWMHLLWESDCFLQLCRWSWRPWTWMLGWGSLDSLDPLLIDSSLGTQTAEQLQVKSCCECSRRRTRFDDSVGQEWPLCLKMLTWFWQSHLIAFLSRGK